MDKIKGAVVGIAAIIVGIILMVAFFVLKIMVAAIFWGAMIIFVIWLIFQIFKKKKNGS